MRALSLLLLTSAVLLTSSCELFKPKDAAASTYDPYGQQTNPYGQAPANNPYGQAAAPNPYAQTPAANPYGSYEQPQTYSSPPPSPYTSTPAATGGGSSGGSVTVKSGDTLTGIARRNNTSVSALKSANGLTSDLIKPGQRLNLP